MGRVEWTRLEGGDVEALVAMFVNREHPNSTRITPSRGDGGVDILDRRAGADGSDVVYQVKRYTEPLGSKEKSAVEDSLKTLMEDPRWAELNVKEWHLVLPWDPSPEAYAWLQRLGADRGLAAIWNGLSNVEAMATKYPEVVDYYLHGGSSQIKAAYEAVAALLGAERTEKALRIDDVHARVSKALLTLEDDPHYRYEHRFGSGELPTPSSGPDVVLHMQRQDGHGGPWSTVDVIARCAASTTERPIVFRGVLKLEAGSEAERAFHAAIAYGAPFQSPQGAFDGELDAPAGLGGPLEGATVSITSPTIGPGDDPELHVQMLSPVGRVLGAVDLDRVERSEGIEGRRIVLEETGGVFLLEDWYNVMGKPSSRHLSFKDFSGKPVAKVLPALTFLANCRPPNRARVSRRHTPPELGLIDVNWNFEWPEEVQEELRRDAEVIGILALLQGHSITTIKVPRADEVTDGQFRAWLGAAKLLDGEEVVQTYEDGHAIFIDIDGAPNPEGSFTVSYPLEVLVGSQRVELGQVGAYFDTPTFLGTQEIEGRQLLRLQTSNRQVVWRRLADEA